ncbi:MAG: universal stress protein [Chloroflexi bacterium]|nr:universal stress protein [Chloroflexota bacterium]MBV9601385.1 universal stress protein [Chloroflexota bacterium]
MFSRILVPLDGTPESNAALPAARTIAHATDASVYLLQVLESPAGEASANDAANKLTRVAGELGANGVRVESAVRRGQAADEIIQQVREQAADLVIMRTRGRAGIERAVLGSVGERLLSRSDVPIVMLRPGGRRLDRIANVLVPVDGSPGGALAMSHAVGLAKATGAQIRLLEVVVPMVFQALTPNEGPMYYDPAWDDEALSAAQTYVAGMVTRLGEAGVVASGEARTAPDIPGAIVQAADEHTADLIVMSTQALTGLQRALLGSVADAVVRASACPVLLLHRRNQEES